MNQGGIYDVAIANVVLEVESERTEITAMTHQLDEMVEAQRLWRSKNVQNYTYRYMETTGALQSVFPWSVIVRNALYATGEDANGNGILYGADPHPYIMEELFDRIQDAFREDVPFIEVRYNAIHGYPEDIYIIGNDKVAADATYHAEVYGFMA